MKKILLFYIILLTTVLVTVLVPNAVTNAASSVPEYTITNIDALDYEGNQIPNCEGVFSFIDGGITDSFENEQDKIFMGYYPYVFFIPSDPQYAESVINYYYKIAVEDLPLSFYQRDSESNELIYDPEDLSAVLVINGKWATSVYSMAVDINSKALKSGTIGYLESIDFTSNEETIYNFKVCFENSFPVVPYYYKVSSLTLSEEVINTFNTSKLIGVFHRRWAILSDYELMTESLKFEVAIKIPDKLKLVDYFNKFDQLEFYTNFSIPVDNISHVKFELDFIFRKFYFWDSVETHVYENEHEVVNNYSFNNLNTKIFSNDSLEKGKYQIGDHYYEWKLILNTDDYIFPLRHWHNEFKGFGDCRLIELTYDYLGYTYKYVGDPITGNRNQDPEYSPPDNKWDPEDTKILVKNILVTVVVCVIGFVLIRYIVYPLLLNKKNNNFKKRK